MLVLIVTPLTPDTIRVDANARSSHGSMGPTLVVRPDQAVSVSVGDLGPALTVRQIGGGSIVSGRQPTRPLIEKFKGREELCI